MSLSAMTLAFGKLVNSEFGNCIFRFTTNYQTLPIPIGGFDDRPPDDGADAHARVRFDSARAGAHADDPGRQDDRRAEESGRRLQGAARRGSDRAALVGAAARAGPRDPRPANPFALSQQEHAVSAPHRVRDSDR